MAAPYVQKILAPLSIKSCSIEIEHGLPDELTSLARSRVDSPDGRIKLLYVGRIVPTKGLRYAIRALSKTKFLSSVELTVVGDGDDLRACQDEVDRLGLHDYVHLLGWKSKQEVEDFYNNADIFIFPSFREPTGGVLLEAMMHGLPCITCAYGGPDYMVDDLCGIKIAPSSDDDYVVNMASAIDRLVADHDLRNSMSQHAFFRARNAFSWQAKRIRMSSLYEKLATRKN
jgi:glycosyltransferase involved in cell wall biosynthesis